MSNERICPQCQHLFEPQPGKPEIQCPKCGTLQDMDMVRPSAAEAVAPEGETTEEATDEVAAATEQTKDGEPPPPDLQPVYSSIPKVIPQLRPSESTIWQSFGATFLVCALFLSWVAYDKMLRFSPAQLDQMMTQAVTEYRNGNRQEALKWVDQVLRNAPHSKAAQELRTLINESEPQLRPFSFPDQEDAVPNGE